MMGSDDPLSWNFTLLRAELTFSLLTPLHSHINMHILHIVLCTFAKVMTKNLFNNQELV